MVLGLGRNAVGVGASTMALYVQTRTWHKATAGLKSHALILAKAMDLKIGGEEKKGKGERGRASSPPPPQGGTARAGERPRAPGPEGGGAAG